MKDKRQAVLVIALGATIAAAVYMVAQLNGQERAPAGNFTNAATAEVRDAQGQVVLRGQFVLADEEDDDIERKATLKAAGNDADAAGEAEVEFAKAAATNQEIEFSVRNLQAGVALTFVIDGVEVGNATVDRRGRAELEVEVPLPGTTPAR